MDALFASFGEWRVTPPWSIIGYAVPAISFMTLYLLWMEQLRLGTNQRAIMRMKSLLAMSFYLNEEASEGKRARGCCYLPGMALTGSRNYVETRLKAVGPQ
jgi:hypothetical protein